VSQLSAMVVNQIERYLYWIFGLLQNNPLGRLVQNPEEEAGGSKHAGELCIDCGKPS
jgi:hypothetical protein